MTEHFLAKEEAQGYFHKNEGATLFGIRLPSAPFSLAVAVGTAHIEGFSRRKKVSFPCFQNEKRGWHGTNRKHMLGNCRAKKRN